MEADKSIPEDTLGRVFEAISRSVNYLPAEARAQFQSLLQPETLWAMAIIFGLWAGLQLLPTGPLTILIMTLAEGYVLVRVFGRLKDAIVAAANAADSAQLDAAAKMLADVWVEIGINALIGIISSRAFRLLEGQVLRLRPYLSRGASARPVPKVEPKPNAPSRPVVPEPAPKVPGAGTPPRPLEPPPAPAEPVVEPIRRPAESFEPEPTPAEPFDAEPNPEPAQRLAPEATAVSEEAAALRPSRLRGAVAGVTAVEGAPVVVQVVGQAFGVGKWILLGTGLVVLGAGAVAATRGLPRPVRG